MIGTEYDYRLCPRCHVPPIKILDGDVHVVTCPSHKGYMAIGKTQDKAREHWNIFIDFVKRDRS